MQSKPKIFSKSVPLSNLYKRIHKYTKNIENVKEFWCLRDQILSNLKKQKFCDLNYSLRSGKIFIVYKTTSDGIKK